MLIIHNDIGTTYGPRVYLDRVDHRKRAQHWVEQYAINPRIPNNYPVPAIPLTVIWIGEKANPFYGIEIRDNQQWANLTWCPMDGLEYHPRMVGQCEWCGAMHHSDDCPI